MTTGYRLVAAEREDRRADSDRSATSGVVDLRSASSRARSSRSISRPARSASTRRRPSSGTSRSSARRCAKAPPSRRTTTPRGWCAPSTCAPASCCGSSTRFRAPASSATTRGRRSRGPSNGNVGVWTQITVDEELGLVYLPVETPTSDFYGGHRPGNNLFAESLVVRRSEDRAAQVALPVRAPSDLELRHARRRRSSPTSPSTASRVKVGRAAEQAGVAVRLRSRDRRAGLADRGAAGAAVRRAGREDVADAAASPTKPPAYARNYLKVPDDLIDFTPELRAAGARAAEAYKCEPSPFTPPILGNVNGRCSARSSPATATNWPGGGLDPETHIVFAPAGNTAGVARSLVAPPTGILGHPLRLGHRRPGRSARCWDRATAARPTRRARVARASSRGRRRRAGRGADRAAGAAAAGPDRAGAADGQAAVRGARRRSISIAASCCGRCRTATRRTTSATIPLLHGHEHSEDRPARDVGRRT